MAVGTINISMSNVDLIRMLSYLYTVRMSSEQNTNKRKKVKICGDITYENSIKDWTQCCFLLPKKMK